MNRIRFSMALGLAGLLSLACGGGGSGSPAAAASNPPSSPLHTAIVERIAPSGEYTLFTVMEDGTGWRQISQTGISTSFLRVVGDRVIYVRTSTSDIWSCKLDGSDHVALASSLFDMAFRGVIGNKVIFTARTGLFDPESYTLYAINADGSGGPIELDATSGKKVFQAIAGGKVFYQHTLTPTDSDLFVVDPDGTNRHDLSAASGTVDRFGYLDGTKVYYVQETDGGGRFRGLYAHNLDGSGSDTQIFVGPVITQVHGVVSGRVILSYTGASGENWIKTCTTDGATVGDIFNIPGLSATFRGFVDNQVVFERPYNTSTPDDLDIWVRNVDESGLMAIAQTGQVEMVESIVGNRIIYSSRTSAFSQADLRVISSDGSHPAPLAVTSDNEQFATTLNNQLAYARKSSSGADDLYLVNLDGSGTLALTNTPETELLNLTAFNRVWFCRYPVGGTTARAMVISPTPGAVPTSLSDGTGFDHVVAVF
jgi:hypothetical protein